MKKVLVSESLTACIMQHKKPILIVSVWTLVSSVFFLLAPYLSKVFIDSAFIGRDMAKFLSTSLMAGVLFIAGTAVKVGSDVVGNKLVLQMRLRLAQQFTQRLFSRNLASFSAQSTGENAYRLTDVDTVAVFLLGRCPQFVVDCLKLVIIGGIAAWLNLPMTIGVLVASPLFIIPRACLQKRLAPLYAQRWELGARLSRETHESFSKIAIVKAMGLEIHQRRRYLRALVAVLRQELAIFRLGLISTLSASFISKGIYGLLSLYGGWLIIKGQLSLGSYAAVMMYILQLAYIVESLGYTVESFAREKVSLERFFEIVDNAPAQPPEIPASGRLNSLRGEIRFEDVWFGYRQGCPIIKGLRFCIPQGGWVAIVGPSGCGKTTLVNLLLRLYEPWRGQLWLDQRRIRDISLPLWHAHIGVAMQQPFLFDISVRENIACGLPHVNQGDVEEASRIASVHEHIRQLPQGYDTIVGEDACLFSQGLKQRIALARALLRKPDLLILDEATASVDSLTEQQIFQQLTEARKGLTTIIVSHRLFSVRQAQRIYFLHEDGVLEEGTHHELFGASEAYRQFFENQLEIQ